MFLFLITSDLYPPFQLTTDPVGWDGLTYALQRDPKYHGITFSVSLELRFEKRAAQYIRGVYEAQGIEGVVRLTIYERNANELRPEEVYSGRLDLTRYSTDATGVTVPLNETGFTQKFLNGDSLDVDLLRLTSQNGSALPALDLPTVGLHSQPILKRYSITATDARRRSGSSYVTDGESRFQTLYFGVGPVKSNTDDVDDFSLGSLPNGPIKITSGGPEASPIFTATEAGDFSLDFLLKTHLTVKQGGSVSLPVPFDIRFHKVDATYYVRVGNEPAVQLAHFAVTGQVNDLTRSITLSHQHVYALRPGQQVYVYGVLHVYDIDADPTSGNYSFEVYQDMLAGSYFKLSAATTTAPTTTKGLLAYEALARCAESITDTPGVLYSEYFGRTDTAIPYPVDGPGSLRLIASSWLLRNFPLAEKPFFLTFRDLYESLDATDCLGCGTELRGGRQVVRVEPRSFFYQPTVVLALQDVQELKKTAASDRFYNAVQVGYQKWSSSSLNGLKEVNGSRTYNLPITQAPAATYAAMSKIVAAGYLLEETRRDQYQATSGQESRGDGDAYFICLRRLAGGGFETERSQPFSLIDGVLSPESTYNLRLTPGRILRRHGAWLRAGLLRQNGRKLTRGASEGFDQVTTQLTEEATPVVENAELPVEALPAALYQPEIYEAKAVLRPAELRRIYANPYGLVSLPKGQGSGFLLKLEVAPRTHLCTLQLLRYD